MTPPTPRPGRQAVPAGLLHRGDHVELHERVVEVLDLAGHPDFPHTCRLLIRAVPHGIPVWTMLPDDQRLTGLHLPRRVQARCGICRCSTTAMVDLAIGVPRRFACARCTSPTTVLPQVVRDRHPHPAAGVTAT
jgi:hypothetical protein